MKSQFRLEQHPLVFLRPRISHPYGWVGHIPFAYLLIDLLRPSSVVELGTHSGNSYLAFCQAVVELGLDTQCTAVDSWEGDVHAQQYGSDVLAELKAFHDPRYAGFSHLSQKYFDDAADDFEDGSIDLLHIDGLHTYEAVRNDFEVWLPKLSDRAVVILHDAEVKDRNFGVWKFVGELASRYRVFQFRHSNGLAVVEVGTQVGRPFKQFMDRALARPEEIRAVFERLAGTLLGDDGLPHASTAMVVSVPVTCHVYLRDKEGTYSEESSLQQTLASPDRLCTLEFSMGAHRFPDFVRVDFSETPGVFGIYAIGFVGSDGEMLAVDRLDKRVSQISGELLPTATPGGIRLVSFDRDPYVEFDLRDVAAMAGYSAPPLLRIALDYELVASDPVIWRLIGEAGNAVSDLRQSHSRVHAIASSLDEMTAELRGNSRKVDALQDRVAGRIDMVGETILALSERTMMFNDVLSATNDQLHRLTQEFDKTSAGAAAVNTILAEATSHLHHLLQESSRTAAGAGVTSQMLATVISRLEQLSAEVSKGASDTGVMNQMLADAAAQLHSLSIQISSSAADTGMMSQGLADATAQLQHLASEVAKSEKGVMSRLEQLSVGVSKGASDTGAMNQVLADATAQLQHLASEVAKSEKGVMSRLEQLSAGVSMGASDIAAMNQALADAAEQLRRLAGEVATGAADMTPLLAGIDTSARDIGDRILRQEEDMTSLISLVRGQSGQILELREALAGQARALDFLNAARPIQRLKRFFRRK